MKKTNFNNNWQVRHLSENEPYKIVNLPHDAMLDEPRNEKALGGLNICYFEGKDYEYIKEFMIEKDHCFEKYIFEFEGVYNQAEVYINDQKCIFWPYGYSNFYVDATDYLKIGEKNIIRVIAHNSKQPNSRWYSGAGIYRNVNLYTASSKDYLLLNGVKIKTLSINPAIIEVQISTSSDGNVHYEIYDENNNMIITDDVKTTNKILTFQKEIKDPQLWNVLDAHLYTLKVNYGNDEVRETFGIRVLEYSKEGFFINNQSVLIKGACVHSNLGIIGAYTYKDVEEYFLNKLLETGYNAIRSAHNPLSKSFLELCDQYGVLVLDEFVDCWYIHKTKYDYVNYFPEFYKKDLFNMVEKDFNHPSVIGYSLGNEVGETSQEKGILLLKEMNDYVKSLDSTRFVTCGINIFFNYLTYLGFGQYSDKKAEKEEQKAINNLKSKKKKKAVGSEFFNNLAGMFGDEFMKTMATLPGCDKQTKKAFAQVDVAGYNYGIKRYKKDLKNYPERLILGSETFCNDTYKFLELAKTNSRIIGDFVWAGIDYMGEVGVGSWEYSDYATNFTKDLGWISAGSGRIDLTGKLLGEALYTKVCYFSSLKPEICVVPVNHTFDKHSPSAWKMSNALNSWSFRGYENKIAKIEIYSCAPYIELFLNDKSLGIKKTKENIAKFKTKYQSGILKAVALDSNKVEVASSYLESAAKETILTIEEEKNYSNYNNLKFIRFSFTDHNKIIKPLEKADIELEISGGKLIAFGNGCPFNIDGYRKNKTFTYFGEAFAVILKEDEIVTIKATTSNKTYTSSFK